MKKIYLILIIAGIAGLQSCKDEKPVLDAPGSKLEGINAEWILQDVDQVDINSIAANRLKVSQAFINGDAMQMTFNSDAFTYSVVKGGAPDFFKENGTWAFDDNEYPTLITLTPVLGDDIILPLVRTIRPQDAYLNFAYERTCGPEEKAYVRYEFKFIRK